MGRKNVQPKKGLKLGETLKGCRFGIAHRPRSQLPPVESSGRDSRIIVQRPANISDVQAPVAGQINRNMSQ